MGKKRKFNRFIRWIKSDLPEENSPVLLLGVKKLPSPTIQRRDSTKRPHTLHFDFPVSRSSTISSKFDALDNTHSSFNDLNSIPKTPPGVFSRTDGGEKAFDKAVKRLSLSENNTPSLSPNGRNIGYKLKPSCFHTPEIKYDRKRVSFSKDADDLINSCEDLENNCDSNNRIFHNCTESGVEISDHFIELPVCYCNNYTYENRSQNSTSRTNEKPIVNNTLNSNVNVSRTNIKPVSELVGVHHNDRQRDEIPSLCPSYKLKGHKSSIDHTDVAEILDAIANDLIGPKPRSSSLKSDSVNQLKSYQNKIDNIEPALKEDTFGIERRSKSLSFASRTKLKPQYFRNKSIDTATPVLNTSLRISEEDLRADSGCQCKNSNRFIPFEKKCNDNSATSKRRVSEGSLNITNKDIGDILTEIIEELDITPRNPRSRSRSRSQSEKRGSDPAIGPVRLSVDSKSDDCSDRIGFYSDEKENYCLRLGMMDRSVDSIGSCSLDVDMSTDFSDSSVGSISDCTLRSVSILTPISNGKQSLIENKPVVSEDPNKKCTSQSKLKNEYTPEPIIKITDFEVTSKKPSYLNLACCVSGYNNLTTYDSKLRENYRAGAPKSREVSPNRPFSSVDNYASHVSKSESNFLTPDLTYNRKAISSDTKLKSPNMAGSQHYPYINKSPEITDKSTFVMMQNGTSQSYSSMSSTRSFMSTESKNFASSMLFNGPSTSVDTTDACAFRIHENPQHFMSSVNSSMSNSSYRSSKTVTTTIKTLVNGSTQQSYSDTNITENYASKQSPSKSFIQQRVERLYGPGALAQGFFISTKRSKNRISESEVSNEENTSKTNHSNVEVILSRDNGLNSQYDKDNDDDDNNPPLPVLRHLRPEFRAQLPIMSPKRFGTDKSSHEIPVTIKINGTNGTSEPNIKSEYDACENDSETINELKPAKAVENFVTILKDPINDVPITSDLNMSCGSQISLDSLTEHLPAAPQVVLPVPVASVTVKSDEIGKENFSAGDESIDNLLKDNEEVKDGHYFLKILKNETDRLSKLAEQVEDELELKKTELPDEILGYLRSASGKARLLVSQKMQQFEGLCHKNINQLEGEPFPTTAEDLQGFWDMVMLQVTQVNDLFKDLDALRANNWVEIKDDEKDVSSSLPMKRKVIAPRKVNTANSEAQRKQREAQRKLMLEQRRKAIAEKKNQKSNADEQSVEIFMPDVSASTS